jgi:hypothetical protein
MVKLLESGWERERKLNGTIAGMAAQGSKPHCARRTALSADVIRRMKAAACSGRVARLVTAAV